MSRYCPQCSNEYSEHIVPVQFNCCAFKICRRCAFYGWVHNSKRCWNKECNHGGELRIKKAGKSRDASKFNNEFLKETVLNELDEFIHYESSHSDEDSQASSSLGGDNEEYQVIQHGKNSKNEHKKSSPVGVISDSSPHETDVLLSSGESSDNDDDVSVNGHRDLQPIEQLTESGDSEHDQHKHNQSIIVAMI